MTPPLAAPDSAHHRVRDVAGQLRRAAVGRIGIRMLATVALIFASFAVSSALDSGAAIAATGTCSDGSTVVVDFTNLGGKLEAGCAEGKQETGRGALLAAGFTATDSQPGLLCAINSMPDPCPETFDGSFWSYWHAAQDGEWTSYQVGADSSHPVPGQIEGWRYDDGTTPPGIAPASVSAAITTQSPKLVATPRAAAPGNDDQASDVQGAAADVQAEQNAALTATTIGFLALIVVLIVIFVVRARRRGPGGRN